MSISNLEVPNSYNLFVNSLTSATPIVQQQYYRVDQAGVSQSLPSGAATSVQFGNNLVASNFAPPTVSNTTYMIPVSGLYEISYAVAVLKNGTGVGQCTIWIQPPGTTLRYGESSANQFEASALTAGPPVSGITLGNDADFLTGWTMLPFNAGDLFVISAFQNSGAARTMGSALTNQSYLAVKKVG